MKGFGKRRALVPPLAGGSFRVDKRMLQPKLVDRMRRTIRRPAEPEDGEHLLRSLIGVADEIVAANWPSAGRLADELRSKGFLDEGCMFLWLREHQAKDCSTRELPIRTSPRDR